MPINRAWPGRFLLGGRLSAHLIWNERVVYVTVWMLWWRIHFCKGGEL